MGSAFLYLLLLFAALAPTRAVAENAEPRVQVEHLRCKNEAQVIREIEARALELLGSDERLKLWVRAPDPSRLVVHLTGSGRDYERALSFRPAECEALPMAIAYMVRAWMGDITRRAVSETPPRSEEAAPEASDPRLPLPGAERDLFESRERSEAGVLVGILAGLGSAIPLDSPSFKGSFWADWPLSPRYGAALMLATEPSLTAHVTPGEVSASLYTLSAALRGTLLQSGRSTLALQAGPSFYLLRGTSQGFSDQMVRHRAGAALTCALSWRLALWERGGGKTPLQSLVALTLSQLWKSEEFRVEGVARHLRVESLRFALEAGLAFEAF